MVTTYKTIRSRRRSIGLEVTLEGAVIVRLPHRAPQHLAHEFIEKKKRWLIKTLEKVKQQQDRYIPKRFEDGERFLFTGDTYPLQLVNEGRFSFKDGMFRLPRRKVGRARELFTQWYRDQARQIITERVAHYMGITGLVCRRIAINGARTRWGSCGHRDTLNFSWHLVLAPLEIIDYVVAHEVVHLDEKNHSRRFWNKVEALIPDHKKYRRWLKEHGHALFL